MKKLGIALMAVMIGLPVFAAQANKSTTNPAPAKVQQVKKTKKAKRAKRHSKKHVTKTTAPATK